MKTIIASLLLLFCFNLSAQWKPSVSSDYDKWKEDQSKNYSNVKQPTSFNDIPQSEINLGLHKFGEQHRTGNHLIIAGLVATTLGSLLINPIKDSYPAGVFFMAVGGGLTTAGFIVNIDSFRHIR
jgi:hypothetical protein